jgi:hypothetical protein
MSSPSKIYRKTNIRYIEFSPSCPDRKLKGYLSSEDLIYPLDLPSLWACEAAGFRCHTPASMADNVVADKIYRAATRIVTEAIFRRDLFEKDFGPVNPLYVPAHWLVALLGGVAVKTIDLVSISHDVGERPALLVETAEPIPFVPTYGEIANVLIGCGVPHRQRRHAAPLWRTRLARAVMTAKSRLLSFGQRARQQNEKPALLLAQNLPDLSALLEANINLGEPFSANGFDFKWRYSAPPRSKWVLPRILPQLGECLHRIVDLPVPERDFVTILLAAYEAIGGEFEGCILEAMKPTDLTRGGVLLVPALVKMPFRADVYRAWREGLTIVNAVYSDGSISGSFALDVDLYRISLASLNLYSGSCASLARDWRKRSGLVPDECLGDVQAVGISLQKSGRWKASNISPKRRKVLYLPNAFSGNVRLGPQREQHDIPYWHFQLNLLRSLAKIENVELIYKAHPKSFVLLPDAKVAEITDLGVRYVERALDEEILRDVDCLVADHFATGVSKALECGVNVVLVETGYRRLLPEMQRLAEKSIDFVDSGRPQWQEQLTLAVKNRLDTKPNPCHEEFLTKAMGLDIPGNRAENILRVIADHIGETV